jgi:hypothetical protein
MSWWPLLLALGQAKEQPPHYRGPVRILVYEEPIALEKIKAALDAVKGVSQVAQVDGSNEITLDFDGPFAHLTRLKSVLAARGISSELLSPARVYLQPRAPLKDREAALNALRALPQVKAAGLGDRWGLPDPSIGVLNHGSMLDAKPVVTGDRKYVMVEARPESSELIAMCVLRDGLIAFVEIDEEILGKLLEAVEEPCDLRSHEILEFTFSEAGKADELSEELRALKGVLRIRLDESRLRIVAAKGSVKGWRVKSMMSRFRFKHPVEVE